MLEIAFIFAIYSIVSCFQLAAGMLAWRIGKSFWIWFWISLFLPIISLFMLILMWDDEKVKEMGTSW
jgi:hypothetical protein